MTRRLPHIFSWLVTTLVFFIPSNLFFVLNESWGYVNGLRIDYILPKLFLTDVLIVPIIVIGLLLKKRALIPWLQKNRWLVLLGVLFITAQLFSAHSWTSLFTAVKGVEMIMLFAMLLLNKERLPRTHLVWAMTWVLAIQLFFASFQFLFQKSFTPYWLLGESTLTSSMIGLARSSIGGEERLLAYGTTAHPNILAGLSVLFFLLVLQLSNKKNSWWLLAPVAFLLFFTQSVSALLALIIGLILIVKKNLLRSNILRILLFVVIITPFFIDLLSTMYDSTSLTRRAGLHRAALEMVENQPLIGVGLNNFTVVLEDFTHQKEFVRFIQPVHNSIWLLAAESGVVGLLLFWLICRRLLEQYKVLPLALTLAPILSLDHYLTTTQTGLLLLIFFVVLTLITIPRHRD